MDEIKKLAVATLAKSRTEEEATENLEKIGLSCPVVTFSRPNAVGQTMKMGMAYYGQHAIHF